MAFIRAFKTPKNQKFEYRPRFWDPQKEEWEERKKELFDKGNRDNSPEAIKSRISKGMRNPGRPDNELRSKLVRNSNYRLVGIIILLIVLSYFAITIYLPRLLENL